MPVIGRSLSRGQKSRQQRLTEVLVSVSGGASPVAGGIDFVFVKSIERSADGVFKITYKDTASRNLQVEVLHADSSAYLAYAYAVDKNSVTIKTQVIAAILGVKASKVVQDLTYTADATGAAGNAITIAYTAGATAGSEVVSVIGTAISVQIATGVSTATQIKAAVDASVAAAALVDVSVSGTGSNTQVVASAAALTGGVTAYSAGDLKDADFQVGILWHGAARVF